MAFGVRGFGGVLSIRFSVSLNLASRLWRLLTLPIPFEASRLKIERAELHIRSLETAIAAYMETEPAHVKTRLSADREYIEHEFFPVHDVPARLSPIVGDAIHNLRVSLDLLAVEVVGHNPQANTNNVYFPFAKSAAELDTTIRDKNFHRAADEAVTLLRTLKPYPEGNPSLRYVHDLDIMDKHKALVPVAGHVMIGNVLGLGVPHGGLMQLRSSGQVIKYAALASGLLPTRSSWSIQTLVPMGQPLADRELVPTLDHLAQDFSAIVDAFENLLLGQSASSLPPLVYASACRSIHSRGISLCHVYNSLAGRVAPLE